jgi:hypothetical protein
MQILRKNEVVLMFFQDLVLDINLIQVDAQDLRHFNKASDLVDLV